MGNRSSAAEDTREYREGYPGQPDDLEANRNLEFYSGNIVTSPGGDSVERFHKNVSEGGRRGNYQWLEDDHSYIQWLFPIREPGLNPRAQVLQKHEADAIASDPVLQRTFIESYRTMLDFYGMALEDETTGKVVRKAEGFESCYTNLNYSFHNNLRITRILKALGEVGLEHYKPHFVKHILTEIYLHGHLTECRTSCVDYWAQTLKNDSDRQAVEELATKLHAESDVMPVHYDRYNRF
eukprot:TRINITY_DN26925_c0_g1_i1.p1 TRINITY_DN26925_c0_g1~~TRINITY_DN26925_c0_g1_i1.p1  ORF type:complete len:238 (+),score=42.31 TRINITY_DN26925_c0_g1_i1:60-773(+)